MPKIDTRKRDAMLEIHDNEFKMKVASMMTRQIYFDISEAPNNLEESFLNRGTRIGSVIKSRPSSLTRQSGSDHDSSEISKWIKNTKMKVRGHSPTFSPEIYVMDDPRKTTKTISSSELKMIQ